MFLATIVERWKAYTAQFVNDLKSFFLGKLVNHSLPRKEGFITIVPNNGINAINIPFKPPGVGEVRNMTKHLVAKYLIGLGFAGMAIMLLMRWPVLGLSEASFCGRCHAMNFQVQSYQHSSHRQNTNCGDCHDPHGLVTGSTYAAYTGSRHVFRVITNTIPKEIKATKISKKVMQANCSSLRLTEGEEYAIPDSSGYHLAAHFIPDYDRETHGLLTRSPWPNNPKVLVILKRQQQPQNMILLGAGESGQLGRYPITFNSYEQYSGLTINII